MTKPTPILSDEEAVLRTRIYQHQRLENQKAFYRSRIDEFRLNSGCMLLASAVLMGLSTTISLLSISSKEPFWMLLTAILPAVAAALAAFRAVYQWERQTSLYEDSLLELRRAGNVIVGVQPDDYEKVFPALVRRSETVFQNEAGQWGQIKGVMPTDTVAADDDKKNN
jgi:hypothetical protein